MALMKKKEKVSPRAAVNYDLTADRIFIWFSRFDAMDITVLIRHDFLPRPSNPTM